FLIVPVPSPTTSYTFSLHDALPISHFGAGSFAKHLAEAKQASAQIVLRRNFRLEMDVDDESDLHALLEYDLSATATGRWLCEAGLDVKFRSGRKRETKVAAGNHL